MAPLITRRYDIPAASAVHIAIKYVRPFGALCLCNNSLLCISFTLLIDLSHD